MRYQWYQEECKNMILTPECMSFKRFSKTSPTNEINIIINQFCVRSVPADAYFTDFKFNVCF